MSARVFHVPAKSSSLRIVTGTDTFADVLAGVKPNPGDLVALWFDTTATATDNNSTVITDAASLVPGDAASMALYAWTGSKWVPVAAPYDTAARNYVIIAGASTVGAGAPLTATSATSQLVVNAAESSTAVIGLSAASAAVATGGRVPVVYKGPAVALAADKMDAGGFVKSYGGGYVGQGLISQVSLNAAITGIGYANQPGGDHVEVLSSNAADITQTVTVWYVTASDPTVLVSEAILLDAVDGTTPVQGDDSDVGTVLGFTVSAAHAGTITVRVATGAATIGTLTTGNLVSGITTLADPRAYLQIPTVVGSGATTKLIAVSGYLYDDVAMSTLVHEVVTLDGTTAVPLLSRYFRITKVYAGDLESNRTVTAKSSATADTTLSLIGRTINNATAQGDAVLVNVGL